jgi:hypothetical protein
MGSLLDKKLDLILDAVFVIYVFSSVCVYL